MTQFTFKHNPITLVGDTVKVGEKAPSFTVLKNDLSPISLEEAKGKKLLISVVPSIDTGVCDEQTRRFNKDASEIDNTEVWTISVDLPFAQRRWCAAAGLTNVLTLSDHKDLDFGKKYGVVIEEMRLLARSVYVIDTTGTISYIENVQEGSDHPNYEAAIEALRQAK
ncbi:thiol peroxidase [Paenalkalicoccus suaedae]|uniref:Thiol peroxidase n=1 Tax=Paenalkalicoccus suaedae TaxID=2592382 RepID=A0A859FG29_9BACI|nr:thiol peroxidase [Paenalkalicoccus suaedae]QKS72057.1 thiol peroxidase [Paenalkalicoccus suaedae]